MFKQTYNNVKKVENYENGSVKEVTTFEQTYDNVDNVKNTSESELFSKLNSLSPDEISQLIKAIEKKASDLNDKENIHFKNIDRNIKQTKGKKASVIIEYIKAGTVTTSFITALLSLIKTIVSV